MPVPSPAELREMLVGTTFHSDAFTVAKGQKTQWMLETEADKNAAAALARQQAGQPAIPPKTSAPPDPAQPPVLEKLAGVLKYFVGGDPVLDAATKIRFKAEFANVLTQGQLVLAPLCDGIYDAAKPEDVEYRVLRKLGMHRGGEPLGIDSMCKWVKSKTYGSCMPNGDMADDFVCLVTLMRMDPALLGGKLEWNIMDCCVTIDRKRLPDGVLNGRVRMAIGETYSVATPGKRGMRRFVPSDTYVQQAIELLAHENEYHESREYFDALRGTWDGKDYMLDTLKAFGGYMEIEEGEENNIIKQKVVANQKKINDLALSMWTKTLIGCVARTYVPGCQMDTMLVLKSKQGTKKSSLFRAIAPAGRFSDAHIEFGNKDSYMSMQQNTIYECAELSGMVKKEVQITKGFITTRSDDFRLPYAKAMTKNPRHCILVGTTNDDTPFRDQTGSRRFWIIVVGDQTKTDIVYIEMVKPQMWAQILELYFAADSCPDCKAALDGELRCTKHRWWLSRDEDELREKYNLEFTEHEPYITWLQNWVANNVTAKNSSKQGMHSAYKNTDALTVSELLEAAGLPAEKCHDLVHQKRMVVALKFCGYIKRHTEAGNVWISPGMANRPNLSVVTTPGQSGSSGNNGTPPSGLTGSGTGNP